MKDKSINADVFIARDADCIDQVLLVADRAQSRQEPAVPIEPLADITSSRIVFEKHRFFENVTDTFDGSRPVLIVVLCRLQAVQTISPVSLQVELNIEMGITVFCIYSSALVCYLGDC